MTLPMHSKIFTIFEGTSEIQRMLIGRTITALDVRLAPTWRYTYRGPGRGAVPRSRGWFLLVCRLSESSRLFPVVSGPRAESVLIPVGMWSIPIMKLV
jgi:hypothetical protein